MYVYCICISQRRFLSNNITIFIAGSCEYDIPTFSISTYVNDPRYLTEHMGFFWNTIQVNLFVSKLKAQKI